MPQSDVDPLPRLRPGLRAQSGGPAGVVLYDSFHVTDSVLTLSPTAVQIAALFDGSRSVEAVYREAIVRGASVAPSEVAELAAVFGRAGFFANPEFDTYVRGADRNPSCIGCYPAEPAKIRTLFDRLFTAPGGAGLPGSGGNGHRPPGKLRAALLPHMDFARGNVTYGWGFRELIEQTDARLFVIVATSHYSTERFTLTRKNYQTPLGVVETDQAYIDRIVTLFGDDVFADPYAHLPEHSIELEAVLLQHLLADRGPFRIVPLLVGSFHDRVDSSANPAEAEDIGRMVAALRAAEDAAGEPVCYLISGDLAHIGPKFHDPDPVTEPQLAASRRQDEMILDAFTAASSNRVFQTIAAEGDVRRICGLPPSWLTLEVLKPKTGRVLHYQQYIHPQGHESVSFTAAAFYE